MNKNIKANMRARRQKRIRAQVTGTPEKPRLSVFKSNTAMYAQLIDDTVGKTLAAASGKDPVKVGSTVAKLALDAGVKAVVFDRGGYIYAGKVKSLADAAREAGLKF